MASGRGGSRCKTIAGLVYSTARALLLYSLNGIDRGGSSIVFIVIASLFVIAILFVVGQVAKQPFVFSIVALVVLLVTPPLFVILIAFYLPWWLFSNFDNGTQRGQVNGNIVDQSDLKRKASDSDFSAVHHRNQHRWYD